MNGERRESTERRWACGKARSTETALTDSGGNLFPLPVPQRFLFSASSCLPPVLRASPSHLLPSKRAPPPIGLRRLMGSEKSSPPTPLLGHNLLTCNPAGRAPQTRPSPQNAGEEWKCCPAGAQQAEVSSQGLPLPHPSPQLCCHPAAIHLPPLTTSC